VILTLSLPSCGKVTSRAGPLRVRNGASRRHAVRPGQSAICESGHEGASWGCFRRGGLVGDARLPLRIVEFPKLGNLARWCLHQLRSWCMASRYRSASSSCSPIARCEMALRASSAIEVKFRALCLSARPKASSKISRQLSTIVFRRPYVSSFALGLLPAARLHNVASFPRVCPSSALRRTASGPSGDGRARSERVGGSLFPHSCCEPPRLVAAAEEIDGDAARAQGHVMM
jgi:hypothetical protein